MIYICLNLYVIIICRYGNLASAIVPSIRDPLPTCYTLFSTLISSAFVEMTWRCIHLGGHCTLHFPLSVFVSVRESFHALESGEAVNIFGQWMHLLFRTQRGLEIKGSIRMTLWLEFRSSEVGLLDCSRQSIDQRRPTTSKLSACTRLLFLGGTLTLFNH